MSSRPGMDPREDKSGFLDRLGLTAEEKSKVRTLGVQNAIGLLSLIEASRQAFDQFFGSRRTTELLSRLQSETTAEERAAFTALPDFRPSFGAVVDEKPRPLPKETRRNAERDGLIRDIETLRIHKNSSPDAAALLDRLERRLQELMSNQGS